MRALSPPKSQGALRRLWLRELTRSGLRSEFFLPTPQIFFRPVLRLFRATLENVYFQPLGHIEFTTGEEAAMAEDSPLSAAEEDTTTPKTREVQVLKHTVAFANKKSTDKEKAVHYELLKVCSHPG